MDKLGIFVIRRVKRLCVFNLSSQEQLSKFVFNAGLYESATQFSTSLKDFNTDFFRLGTEQPFLHNHARSLAKTQFLYKGGVEVKFILYS